MSDMLLPPGMTDRVPTKREQLHMFCVEKALQLKGLSQPTDEFNAKELVDAAKLIYKYVDTGN